MWHNDTATTVIALALAFVFVFSMAGIQGRASAETVGGDDTNETTKVTSQEAENSEGGGNSF